MYMPCVPLRGRGRPRSASRAAVRVGLGAGRGRRPSTAIRSRPMFSCSSRLAQRPRRSTPSSRSRRFSVSKCSTNGRRQAAGGVARGRSRAATVSVARDRRLLEGRRDRAALDRLAREQVGGAEQHADAGCRARSPRPRRAATIAAERASWMPPANRTWQSELSRRQLVEQDLDHRLPQHEAGARSDVAAALPALEDEAPRALGQVRA